MNGGAMILTRDNAAASVYNKLLQLSLMDSAEASLPRNPDAVKCAAESRRYDAQRRDALVLA